MAAAGGYLRGVPPKHRFPMKTTIDWIAGSRLKPLLWIWLLLALAAGAKANGAEAAPGFRAGAYAMDITPANFPVIVNGGFFEVTTDKAFDKLHARCLALENGGTRVVICVIDSCLIPREFMEEAKALASQRSGIPANRILISTTHTHSAPSVMVCLGSRVDPNYPKFLLPRVVEGIDRAIKNLAPAKAGWAVVEDWDHTHTRRWINRSDRVGTDPFGEQNVRANMHPGYQNPSAIGPSGPPDPGLSILSVQAADGTPLAVLANYSMHYFGSPPLSADYYGKFADKLKEALGGKGGGPEFVGIMSQGTSGDQMWMDYGQPQKNPTLEQYSAAMANQVIEAVKRIQHHTNPPVRMAERDIVLNMRFPNGERLAWARKIVEGMQGRMPKSLPEIYAQETVFLHENPSRPVKQQAIRVGDLGIAALSAEVYAITGLKIKAQSPLQPTFNIELANGEDGYIPPPEQHKLGGYTTWACRTAGLETGAEPKILESVLGLLEEVAGKPRRKVSEPRGSYSEAVLKSKPAAYWRMDEFGGPKAADLSEAKIEAVYEDGIAFYLEGPKANGFAGPNGINRCAHFAGGRMKAQPKGLGETYSVEFWFWNGFPTDVRSVTGCLFGRGEPGQYGAPGDQLWIGGAQNFPGRLVFANGGADNSQKLVGKTEIEPKTWHHVVLTRTGKHVEVLLDGSPSAEISGEAPALFEAEKSAMFFGGRSDGHAGLEGKMDEVAVYARMLSPVEAAQHFHEGAEAVAAPIRKDAPAEAERPLSVALSEALLASKPLAYWLPTTMDERSAFNVSGTNAEAKVEAGVTVARQAGVFSGGRIGARVKGLGSRYSAEFWLRNDLQNDNRPVTAYVFSRGDNGAEGAPGDHLGIGGTHAAKGRLIFFNGNQLNQLAEGKTVLEPKTWNHVALVRDGTKVVVYLNGQESPEIEADIAPGCDAKVEQIFIGGRSDNFSNLTGQMADVAVYGRLLTKEEIRERHKIGSKGGRQSASAPPAKFESLPLSPEQSLKALHVKEGYVAELVAAEPLVKDPVAFDWGADGRLWVAEMADYPLGMDGKGKPGGRIRVLEDTDGDGKYDKSTVFLDGVNFPNGLITWRNGVLVTAAPEIFYAEDTDGDGKADVRKALYRGFKEGNQQLRVNGLRWGLDNWLYCANGWSGGVAESLRSGKIVDLSGRDLRIRPDTDELDAENGVSQFGRNRNVWGEWFGVNNSYPLWHYALPDRYMRRNPNFAAPSPIIQLALPPNPKIYPARPPEKRFHSFEQAGRFTSACATFFYQDSLLFGNDGAQHAFVCEPFHNLAHHEVVEENGVSFTAHRAEDEKTSEFLASEDRWFRPVMTRTGPDGALWVADMYRYMIEHPDWLPANGKEEMMPFYRAGDDYGRIYRILPKGVKAALAPNLAKLSAAQLARQMDSPNGWVRDKVQQMLLWSPSAEAVPELERLLAESDKPAVRMQALCALDGMGKLKPAHVLSGLKDNHPGVRRQAVRLAETFAESEPGLMEKAAELVNDPDAKVRLQLAFSLGESKSARAGQALGRLLVKDHGDPYIAAAAFSSATGHLDALVEAVLGAGGPALNALSGQLLSLAFLAEKREAMARLLEPILAPKSEFDFVQAAAFGAWLDALNRGNSSLEKLAQNRDDSLARRLGQAPGYFESARKQAANTGLPDEKRGAAVRLLGRDPKSKAADLDQLAALLQPATPIELSKAAVATLARIGEPETPALLVKNWAGYGPELRTAVADTLISREAWALDLLRRIENREIGPTELDAARRNRLGGNASKEVQALAKKVFQTGQKPDRERVIESYRAALDIAGEAKDGLAVYQRLCSACHAVEKYGHDIGPNLRSVAGHPAEKLLVSILDPSREVEPRFLAYSCALKNGEELYGIITGETGTSITMKLPDSTTHTVLRTEIKELRGSKLSLMPEGLESALTKREMADLLAFLKQPSAAN